MAIIKYYIIIKMFILILLILFLINISSLIIACLAYTKKIYPPTLPIEYPPSLRNTAIKYNAFCTMHNIFILKDTDYIDNICY